MSAVILKVDNINKSYSKTNILENVSFNINSGEIVGFVGPNGSGKSTTMKCIANLVIPNSGNIKICGYSTKTNSKQALAHLYAQIEHPGLYENMSGLDNLRYFITLYGKKITKERLNEILEFIGIGKMIRRPVRIYSMGMKQRLSLGIAVLLSPDLLILDEPMNGLDSAGVDELRENLRALRNNGTAILISSHRLEEITKIADKILFIKEGNIVGEYNRSTFNSFYKIKVSDLSKAIQLFSFVSSKKKTFDYDNSSINLEIDSKEIQDVINILNSNGVAISDIQKIDNFSIEDIYRSFFDKKE